MKTSQGYRVIVLVAVAAVVLLLLATGISRVGHQMGIGFYRVVGDYLVISDTIDSDSPAKERGLSTEFGVFPVGETRSVAIVTETIYVGSPYSLGITIHSERAKAKWARVDEAMLRFPDGAEQAIVFVPSTTRSVNDTEPFSQGDSAYLTTIKPVDLASQAKVRIRIKYTVEMMDGSILHGETQADMNCQYHESDRQLGLPSV